MRKHILRLLTVLAVVCLGVGVFAACGDDKPKTPDGTTYTLTYDLNGGSGALPKGGTYKQGDTVTVASGEGLTKTDYAFGGWLDGTTKVAAGSSFTMPARNVTLKADWVDPLDGVWTGATVNAGGKTASLTATLVVDGNEAHLILLQEIADQPNVYTYFPLTKAGNGSYTGSTPLPSGEGAMSELTATVSLNVEGKLQVVEGAGSNSATLTFTTKAPLPAELGLTGSYYGMYEGDQTVEIDFTNKDIKVDGNPSAEYGMTVTFVNVADYVVVKCVTVGEDDDAFTHYGIVYKDGETYCVDGFNGITSHIELSDEEPEVPTEYTLKFYNRKKATYEDEGLLETKTVKLNDGDHVTSENRPASDPEDGNHVFGGWYYDNDGTEVKFDDDFIPSSYTETTTFNIYAKWTIVIGNDGLTNAYPGDFGDTGSGIEWKDTISQGNHYIFTGTQKSSISLTGEAPAQNYKSLKFYIWSGEKPSGVFRLDRAVGDGSEWEPDHGRGAQLAQAENWVITMASPTGFGRNTDWLYRKSVQDGTIVIDVDWVNTSMIVVKITLTATAGKTEGYFEQVYTIEGTADHPLAASYKFGFGAEASQTKFTNYEITHEALASEFAIGNENFEMPFTNDTPAWFGNSIKSGEKIVITGTVKSNGGNGWEAPIAYLMSKKGYGSAIFRLDGWVGGNLDGEFFSVSAQEGITNANTNYNTDEGKAAANADTEFLTAMKAGDVALTLTYDWTSAGQIVITAKFEKGSMTRTTTFTVTAQAEHALAEQYFIGLGGENIYLQVNSVSYPA